MLNVITEVLRLRVRVRTILANVPVGHLDDVLTGTDIARLVRLLGTDVRPLADIVRGRSAELRPATLARIVHALQQRKHSIPHRTLIRDAFLGAKGQRLRDLCLEINWLGDHHDLEHVVFEGLDPILRVEVLRHIDAEAHRVDSAELRILSDIDDTVISALHDKRWPRGKVYPGVVEFVRALDHGASDAPGRAGDLTFVTARPMGPGGVVEKYTRNGLSGLGFPPHAVLGGSIFNLLTLGSIAVRKLQNFERERQLFPQCRAVFIGDSGQADALVGWAMLQRDADFLAAVFIHNVTEMDDDMKSMWAARGVTVFDTYAGAAAQALEMGLITAHDAAAVEQAVRDGIVEQSERQQVKLAGLLDRELASLGR